jgi:hypothetical protein
MADSAYFCGAEGSFLEFAALHRIADAASRVFIRTLQHTGHPHAGSGWMDRWMSGKPSSIVIEARAQRAAPGLRRRNYAERA